MPGLLRRICITAFLGVFPLLTAVAEPFQQTATRVEAGSMTRIGLINSIDPKTCQPKVGETARLVLSPAHGVAEIRREPSLLTTKDCQSTPVQGYAIYYQSVSGFKGWDTVHLELRVEEINTTDVYFFRLEVR